MDCEYYKDYKGPKLISVMVNNIENHELYKKLTELYGDGYNWGGKLYKSKEILDELFMNNEIILNYSPTKSGIPNWTKYVFTDGDEYINPPLFAPIFL